MAAQLKRTPTLGLNDDFRQIALAQLIETVEAIDPQLLDDIGRLIEQRKRHAQET